MCKVLKVSRSCFYRWYSSEPSKRTLENQMYSKLVNDIFYKNYKRYGSPRITAELRRMGFVISNRRVGNLMRQNGLRSKLKKKFKATTDSNHKYLICKNHLKRNFSPKRLNEVWVSDITYIKTSNGWLYLTTIIDLYDRQVVGWSLSKKLFANQTVIPAYKMAKARRKTTDKLIFHSDRGIQYACNEFRNLISSSNNIIQSMSRKANCWDNAVAESFFKTLKSELIYNENLKTIQETKTTIFEYIEIWYNRKRLHSALGYKTPFEMELEFYKFKNSA